MDALELLHGRVSIPVLGEPGPTAEQMDAMVRAALRAPDHAVLRPWRFIEISGEGRERFGEALLRAKLQSEPDLAEPQQIKMRSKALRAPTIIVVVATLTEHYKVPEVEQLISAGCAANNMILAAHALGLGAMWRTGASAYNAQLMRDMGLGEDEQIVGFLYVGTPAGSIKKVPELDPAEFLTRWPASSEQSDQAD